MWSIVQRYRPHRFHHLIFHASLSRTPAQRSAVVKTRTAGHIVALAQPTGDGALDVLCNEGADGDRRFGPDGAWVGAFVGERGGKERHVGLLVPERRLRLLGPERQMLQIVQGRCLSLLLQAGRRHDLEAVVRSPRS